MKFVSITPKNIDKYETIVETDKKPSLVKLYSPNCGHCIAMQSAWDKLNNHKDLKDMDITIVEVRNDALESIEHPTTKNIEGFPTIRLVVDSKIKKEYDGDRSTDDMVKFIKENVGYSHKGGKHMHSTRMHSTRMRSTRKLKHKRMRSTRKHKRSTRKRSTRKHRTRK